MIRSSLTFLLVCGFTLATWLQPVFQKRNQPGNSAPSVLTVMMGDSRQMFAAHFFAKADAFFHGGYYPTIFDTAVPEKESHMSGEGHAETNAVAASHEHEENTPSFLHEPKDWIERFGRNFFPATHEHLSDLGKEDEILPWLKFSAELDPHRIAVYVTAAYWLRTSLKKPGQAEGFLREGLRNNPDSYEILLELGRIYRDNRNDPAVAENLLNLAVQKWHKQEAAGLKPEEYILSEVLGELVLLEKSQNNLPQTLHYLEELKKYSPNPDEVEKQIKEIRQKIQTAKPAA